MHLIRRTMPQLYKLLREWALPLIGFAFAFSLSSFLSGLMPDSVRLENDLWFGADIKRVINNMTDPESFHFRTYHHPLFSLLMLPVASPLFWTAKMIGLDANTAKIFATQLITSISAGITWILVYLISMKMGLSKYQSFLVGLLFLSSSTFIFWWSTPETFPIGSPTILLPFLLLCLRIKSRKFWLITLIASASITITNFSAGLIAAYARFRDRRVLLKLCVTALVCTSVLFIIQKSYLPPAGSFINLKGEGRWVRTTYRPLDTLYKFFVIPIIAPSAPDLINVSNLNRPTYDLDGKKMLQLHFGMPTSDDDAELFKRMPRFDFSAPVIGDDMSLLHRGVALTWTLFLLNGIHAALLRRRNETCIALIAFIGIQFTLHSLYGDTPFLYSAHYAPAMALIAGYGLLAFRPPRLQFLIPIEVLLIAFLFALNTGALLGSFNAGVDYLLRQGPTNVNW